MSELMSKENSYKLLKDDQQKRFGEFPCFYAYSQDQFEKGMIQLGLNPNDTDKIYHGVSGMYYLRENAKKLKGLMESFDLEFKQAIQSDKNGEKFILDMFTYELANHEYCYTMDDSDTLDYLGLDYEEIENSPSLKKGLKLAKRKICKEENY